MIEGLAQEEPTKWYKFALEAEAEGRVHRGKLREGWLHRREGNQEVDRLGNSEEERSSTHLGDGWP